MTNRTKILIAVLFAVAVGSAGFLFFLKVQEDKAFLQTKLVESQAVDLHKDPHQEGKRSVKMMEKGYLKMLSGEIVEINNRTKSFVLDIDPLGKNEKYIIHTDKRTKFSTLTHLYESNTENQKANPEDENISTSEKYTPVDFNAVMKASQVCVRLNEWVNEGDKNFMAEKVDILIE